MYINDFNLNASINHYFNTADTTGAMVTLSSGALACYKDGSTTESTSGLTLSTDFDSKTGFHKVLVETAADGTFYSAGSDFTVMLTAGTVTGVNISRAKLFSFSLLNRSPLRPATAGRTLAVDASGRADAITVINTSTSVKDTNLVTLLGDTPNPLVGGLVQATVEGGNGDNYSAYLSDIAGQVQATYPTNFGSMAISGAGAVTVGIDNATSVRNAVAIRINATDSTLGVVTSTSGTMALTRFSVSGSLTVAGGAYFTQSSSNQPGMSITGNGALAGLLITGGNSNAAGVFLQGVGTGAGLQAVGGSTGAGIKADGGATSGAAIRLTNTSGTIFLLGTASVDTAIYTIISGVTVSIDNATSTRNSNVVSINGSASAASAMALFDTRSIDATLHVLNINPASTVNTVTQLSQMITGTGTNGAFTTTALANVSGALTGTQAQTMADLAGMITGSNTNAKYTTAALVNAPSGSSSGITQQQLIAQLNSTSNAPAQAAVAATAAAITAQAVYDLAADGAFNVTITPITSTVSSGEVVSPDLMAYQNKTKTFAFTIVDGDGEPIDLSGKLVRFTASPLDVPNEPVIIHDNATSGGYGGVTVSGSSGNTVTVTLIGTAGTASDTLKICLLTYGLENVTDDEAVAKGNLEIAAFSQLLP